MGCSAMDTAANGRLNELIGKEVRAQKQWMMDHEKRMIEWGLMKPIKKPLRKTSSAINFLDQTLGLAPNPYEASQRPKTPELLRHGVSCEEQGRYAYLRRNQPKGPQNRFGKIVTSSHEVGWVANKNPPAQSSPFAHRPLFQNACFRSCGVICLESKDRS